MSQARSSASASTSRLPLTRPRQATPRPTPRATRMSSTPRSSMTTSRRRSDETNDAAAADVEDGAAEAPADTTAADAQVTVEDLVAALEAVTAERDQHLADLQRVSAEFQNFRKQTEKRNSTSQPRPARESPRRSCRCSMRGRSGPASRGCGTVAGQLRGEPERAACR